MGRRFRLVSVEETDISAINPLSTRDWSLSLQQTMKRDMYGFWHSTDKEIKLDKFCQKKYRYILDEEGPGRSTSTEIRCDAYKMVASKHTAGLQTLVLEPFETVAEKSPCLVICLGGPFVHIPNVDEQGSIYWHFRQAGFYVVIPLRRGVIGIKDEWDTCLRGNYGKFDVDDILQGTHDAIDAVSQIDANEVYLYGGSYGGYGALLIAGKYNATKTFKKIISHCGVFNLAKYPFHCKANPKEVMMEYSDSSNIEEYIQSISDINPANYVCNWECPIMIVHALDDETCWFGQSVEAYNECIKHKKEAKLILLPGPHTYEVENKEALFNFFLKFYSKRPIIV